jgi:hypothetical protein
MMVRAANLLTEARRVHDVAGVAKVEADWSLVARRIREEATMRWDDSAKVDAFERRGVSTAIANPPQAAIGIPQGRTPQFPRDGHEKSPRTAMVSPHGRPRELLTGSLTANR